MTQINEYSRTVFFSKEDAGFVATCEEFPQVSSFGHTRDEALHELDIVLSEIEDLYATEGWPLPAPQEPASADLPSGEFRLRLPRTLHAQLSERAAREGVSQNALVTYYLAQALARPGLRSAEPESTPLPKVVH